MEALVIDRKTPPDAIFSLIGCDRVMAVKQGRAVLLTPAVDEDESVECSESSISAIFDKHRFDLTNFKFDRNEANNYE